MLKLIGAVLVACSVAPGQEVAHPGILLGGATTVEIASIDPANEAFEDLEPLKALIGDARVVVLGEQSHGDGAVFTCKVRLIKWLHQELGFDVLCWESGMADVLATNERIADESIEWDAAFAGIFEIWRWTIQLRPLFDYVRETHATDRPLLMAGFDSQMTARDSFERLADRLEALGDAPEVTGAVDALRSYEPGEDRAAALLELSETVESASGWIDANRAGLDERFGSLDVEMASRCASDGAWHLRMLAWNEDRSAFEFDTYERDRRMGDNLVFLADEWFKGRKLIIWAATSHMTHRPEEIEFPGSPDAYGDQTDTAGEVAFAALGDDVFTIGFTALRGRAGNLWREESWPVAEPREGSIEWALDAVEHPFLYLDFRSLPDDHPLRQPRWMRPLGYAWMRAVWPDQMDGVICIDEMFKSSRRVFAPDGYELTVGR